jgi:hypothetical protein
MPPKAERLYTGPSLPHRCPLFSKDLDSQQTQTRSIAGPFSCFAKDRSYLFDRRGFALLNFFGTKRGATGTQGLSGIPIDWPTLLRLGAVIVLAIVVRQAVLHYGRRMIRDKNARDKRKR